MLNSLSIRGYRRFDHFELHDLGRVNLLVGRNDSGKTSILEAIQLLVSGCNLEVFKNALARRGDVVLLESSADGHTQLAVNVKHAFHGHWAEPPLALSISGDDGGDEQLSCEFKVEPVTEKGNGSTTENSNAWHRDQLLKFECRRGDRIGVKGFERLEEQVGLPVHARKSYMRPMIDTFELKEFHQPSCFVPTGSFSVETAGELFQDIALTPDEDRVVSLLQTIEPEVVRIGFVHNTTRWEQFPKGRAGFVLKLRNGDKPISMATLGEGAWRILALSLSAMKARGGVLLVDEIDTGLHFTVLDKLWMALLKLANELDIQIFATTHSGDCVERLAAICHDNVEAGSQVTIQRIDPEFNTAVAYTEREIIFAADRGIEVR